MRIPVLILMLILFSLPAHAKDPALFEPIRKNDPKAVEMKLAQDPTLLDERSELGVSPLLYAAYSERPELVALLRKRVPQLSFFEACVVGDVPTVRRLLARGADLNQRSQDGFTPLGLAVFFRQPSVAKLLIEAGADVDAKATNTLQVAPIHAAVARSDLATLQLLLEAGANPNLTQQRLMRPLHEASAAGNLPVVATLLLYGANPSARNEEGKSAAEFAAQAGHTELGQRLIVLQKR